eukprot:TRINITY_DN88091_c0_g1_i1.p1 TRINITY_DN88091_c0_g1~~TRINITY_DN88091_c0_g1_i1.p1  ORF type:complete len:408 (-),score=68.45 TRINITY_DN88091_c0_g1_i1:131-1276(-)
MAAISATLEELSLRLTEALQELEARRERLGEDWHTEEDLAIVKVPSGCQGGMDLRVEVRGREVLVGLPEGTAPGDELEIPAPDALDTLREVHAGLKNLVLVQSDADAALRRVSSQENELQERTRSLDLRETNVAARESAADAREAETAIGFETRTNELRQLEQSVDSRAIDATARETYLEAEADRLKQLARQLEERESAVCAHEAAMNETEADLLKREKALADCSALLTLSEDSRFDKTLELHSLEVPALLLSQKMQTWQDDHPHVETEVLISECNSTSRCLRSPAGTLGERQLHAEHALATMRKLATQFLKVNQLDDAEKLCREEFDLSRKVFGDSDVRTLSAMEHLANLILHVGNFEEAISLHKQLAVLECKGERPQNL